MNSKMKQEKVFLEIRNIRKKRALKNIHKAKNIYLILFIVVAITAIIKSTRAKYNSHASGTGLVQIANWNINVNGENILANQSTVSDGLNLIIDNSPADGIIRNGDTGYFDIIINPAGTEVSANYEIDLSFTKSNLNSTDMIFTHYSYDNGTNKTEIQNNSITGNFNLNDLAPVTCRVYWEWTGNVSVNNSSDCEINANVKVIQKIS